MVYFGEISLKFQRGKFFNAGQTCITADYVLIHKEVEQEFCEKIERYIKMFYGENPRNSPDFPRIISKQHVKRLEKLFQYGDVVIGGKIDEEVNKKNFGGKIRVFVGQICISYSDA